MASRFFDVAVSLIILILTLPLTVAAAVVISLTSPGGVIYGARRLSRGGGEFTMLKFRSMEAQADLHGSAVTAAGDPRVTPVGRWLRKYKIDEIPQFWNVLRGEMSIFGPRPESPAFRRFYGDELLPALEALPGVTGLCQVVFRNEEELLARETDPCYYERVLLPAKLELDVHYVRNRTWRMDRNILIATVLVILGFSGAQEWLVDRYQLWGIRAVKLGLGYVGSVEGESSLV